MNIIGNIGKEICYENIYVSMAGIIYNKEELQKFIDIEKVSDEELIAILYKKFGIDIIKKVQGIFVIVIYDKEKDECMLVRDKIGLKQLYYSIENNNVYFSFELKKLINDYNIKKELNMQALSDYFAYGYINAPDTIFKCIYKLEHGQIVVIKDGKINGYKYWDIIEKYNKISLLQEEDLDKVEEELHKLIYKSIEKRIKDFDKIGIYLSGGIDSSLVSALANKLKKNKINTYSIGFTNKNRNEAEDSKKIASYIGTNHHELYITEEMAKKVLNKISEYYDEPFADSSEIPAIILSEFVKEYNMEIILTGDGADQLFCGSEVYDRIYLQQNNLKIRTIYKLRNYIKYHNYAKTTLQMDLHKKAFYSKKIMLSYIEPRFMLEDKIKEKNWQIKRMILDLNTFIPNRVLTKMRNASYKNNICIDAPLIDEQIVEYTFKIPHKFKYYNKNKKYILKKILYNYVPEELVNKKKKGFGIPLIEWLDMLMVQIKFKCLNKEKIEKQGIFKYKEINKLINKFIRTKKYTYADIIWKLLVFQLWYERYIEN